MTFRKLAAALALAAAASPAFAAGTAFHDFTPMTGDVGAGTLPEAAPFRLSSPHFSQMTIVARDPAQTNRFDSGNYDMHTLNENGPEAGRYLFTVFETGQAGIQRTDLRTMLTTTIWASPAPAPALNSHVAFDASRWTPWGTFLTAEESWNERSQPVSIYGRLFEVTNPLAQPSEIKLVHRNIIPRVSHEGLAFDSKRNMYFIDERNGGAIYKYTSRNRWAKTGDEYFAAGQTFVLRVGDGTVKEATGQATWVPITDANGVTSIDGRATADLPAFLGTDYDRPEDMEIKTLKNGKQFLYIATTTNHKVFSIDLDRDVVKLFVSRDTIDVATGQPVGAAFANPDNVAIDSRGNIYIVEDQSGGVQDTWFAFDADNDGVAEAVGRWASLSTAGAEGTGLYFDPFRPNVAYINVQHPASRVDRTIMITTRCPCFKKDKDDDDDERRGRH